MADTSLIFNILARGGKSAAAEFLLVAAAADKVNDKSTKLQKVALSGLDKGFNKLTSITKKATKGLLGVSVAAAGLNTALQAGAALAPLTGLLGVVPGVALGAATALVSLKVATSGVGDAFKAAMQNDPKKFAESLKGLAPAAKTVATELHKLRPALLEIRNTAQQALFNPLVGQMTALAKVMAKTVEQGISRVAVQIGLAGKRVAEFARQKESVQLVAQAFNQTQISIGNLQPAIQPVLAGFRSLASVGLSFLPGLSTSLSTVASKFGTWLQQMVATGKAAEWIQNALDTLKQLGGIVSQVGGIISSIFSAASASGSNFLGVIGQVLGQVNAFLKTSSGKAALASIFEGLASLGKSLGPVIGAVITQIGNLAGPIARLASLIGPILVKAINAVGPALVQLAPGFEALFKNLGIAITALAPSLPVLAKAFSKILIAISPLIPVAARLISLFITALAPVLPTLVDAVVKFAAVLGNQLSRVIIAIAPYLPQLAVSLTQILIALTPLLPQFASLLVHLTPVLPVLSFLVTALAPLAPYIVAIVGAVKLWAIAQTLLNVVMAANPIGLVILAVAGLIAIVVAIATKTQFFQKIWHGAWGVIKKASKAVYNWLKDNWPYILGILTGPVGLAVAYITKHWDQVVGFVKKLPGRISSAVKGMWDGIKNGFKGAINWIISRWNNFSLSLGGWRVNLPFGMGFTIPSITLRTPNIPYLAKGGQITGSGMAMVGEKGPELVNLPKGAEVVPNHKIGSALGASASGGRSAGDSGPAVIEIRSGGSKLDDFLVEILRKAIQNRGGNVQVVLGR